MRGAYHRTMITAAREGMVRIESGSFSMGSDRFYPEEAPVREVPVDVFWIDTHAVTNAEFSRFVRKTGYVTVAERPLDPADYPGAPAENLVPGALVFHMTPGPVNLRDYAQWWSWFPGACWKHPEGPGSSIDSRPDHPVVHRARRSRRQRLRLGRRDGTRGQARGKYLARRFPVAQHPAPRAAHHAGRDLSAEWIWALRYGRQRVGMDQRLVRKRSQPGRVTVLRGRCPRTQLRPVSAEHSHPAKSVEGRIVSLFAELLFAFPPGGALAASDRHRHVAPRLSLR
jgi:hypothetical protein